MSIFGDKYPQNGSKTAPAAPRPRLGCPHKGPSVVSLYKISDGHIDGQTPLFEGLSKDLKDLKDLKDPRGLYCNPKGRRAFLRIPSTVGRSVCLCWAPSKPKGPKGCDPSGSMRAQGFAADPVYGRAKCLPMLGSLKTSRT